MTLSLGSWTKKRYMNMNENEKQYYDKIVVLYGKYGENIPDADLMHLSVIEKELGISFQRSQVIFELVKSQAKLEKEEQDEYEEEEEDKDIIYDENPDDELGDDLDDYKNLVIVDEEDLDNIEP